VTATVTPEQRLLSGWGRTAASTATVVRPSTAEELGAVLDDAAEAEGTGVIGRGLGRSYGDAAQCAGGTVVDTSAFDHVDLVDPASGVVDVGAGVSLDALMRTALEHGWFVPVTPGTRQVTVGGAIAADIHGKNHHRDGSFCRHVREMTVVTPSGVHRVRPDNDPELFWATAGGMGLTGIVTRAVVQLIPAETSWMLVDTERFSDLDSVMATMDAADHEYRYSVAWVDCVSSGNGSGAGRAVLTRGDHAPSTEAPPGRNGTLPEQARIKVPVVAPRRLLNPLSVRAFNEMWFRRAPKHKVKEPVPLSTYFHPLDGVANWNLLYGPSGFVQHQLVVGPDQGEAVTQAVGLIADSKVPSFLGVLKRFGPGDPGPLSFPIEGWTLALDFPVGPPALPGLLDQLDQLVAEAGGRVYLAKDSRLDPDRLRAMYPCLDDFERVCRRVDPEGVLQSDLSRRLGIGAGARTPGEITRA
jgi:decaprenylphospho-beta-D-ribofuranose 2-oxidase